MARAETGHAQISDEKDHAIDDQGTHQGEAAHILESVRDTAFDGSSEKLALALGRPIEEIDAWTNGEGFIDGDVGHEGKNTRDAARFRNLRALIAPEHLYLVPS